MKIWFQLIAMHCQSRITLVWIGIKCCDELSQILIFKFDFNGQVFEIKLSAGLCPIVLDLVCHWKGKETVSSSRTYLTALRAKNDMMAKFQVEGAQAPPPPPPPPPSPGTDKIKLFCHNRWCFKIMWHFDEAWHEVFLFHY